MKRGPGKPVHHHRWEGFARLSLYHLGAISLRIVENFHRGLSHLILEGPFVLAEQLERARLIVSPNRHSYDLLLGRETGVLMLHGEHRVRAFGVSLIG